MASTPSDFFRGEMDRDLFYWPSHARETQLYKQEEEDQSEVRVIEKRLKVTSLVSFRPGALSCVLLALDHVDFKRLNLEAYMHR
jgi:hypothetical protein